MKSGDCYHCGLPITGGVDYPVIIDQQTRAMCCPGCQAVATAIRDGGLEQFYQFRSRLSERPERDQQAALEAYDLEEVQQEFVVILDQDRRQISVQVQGITCAACAWLIEHHLKQIPGVISASVNVTTHRALLEWRSSETKLSCLLSAFEPIGYQARPVTDEQAEAIRSKENRRFLQRLGIAGLAMMQAGMIAVGLYAGSFQGMDVEWESYLRWVSLIITSPVVFFSAAPFFKAAMRSLKMRHLTMDVPVSIAIGLAFSASVWATIAGTGEVYFDSVSMFTFFLLLGRYLEMRVRHRNELSAEGLGQLLPTVATRLNGDDVVSVPVKSLRPGDRIRVAVGDTIPCDGQIVSGESAVVEAVLTGEYLPVHKQGGDTVSAGTINSEHPLIIDVEAVGTQTRLSAVLHLVERAQAQKPSQVFLADRVAGYFVAVVLLLSLAVGYWWWQHDPGRMLWVVLSVLVVTCPCALSLATPAALAVASGELRRRGFLITDGRALESLASVNHAVFDKTGTLTLSSMTIATVMPLTSSSVERLQAVAAALEQDSRHPIAQAFLNIGNMPVVENVRHHVTQGISGEIGGEEWAIGRAEFVAETLHHALPAAPDLVAGQTALLLASQSSLQGWIVLQDQLRPNTQEAIASLEKTVNVSLFSGDRSAAVAVMAEQLSIQHWRGDMSPASKLTELQALQSTGQRVVMVGDGINDVPVLSGADVSVAMGGATDLARIHADSILLSGNLQTLVTALYMARRTRRVIRQNLGWALLYNLTALPLAAAGWVPPWAAAIGMSGSSLLVVMNALRLRRNII
ncbi:MAG: cadmium-translocating P-type ATPase [Pseudomonadales bacterium]|nr:cadmium-translocating P-type ATPase [Pseudomonadales bacterium]